MVRLAFVILAAFAVLSVACGGSSDDGADERAAASATAAVVAEASCSTPLPAPPGGANRTFTSGGVTRTYHLHVPAGYDGVRRVPVVFSLHGFALTADFMTGYTRFDAVADREGFIVITPNGAGVSQRWNNRLDPEGADDVAFLGDLLTALESELCIDPKRVYAAGLSNGGGMALRLACALPDRIAAIATVAATYIDCDGSAPMIAIHGSTDPVVPFGGRQGPPERGGSLPPVADAVASWATAAGCGAKAEAELLSSEVQREQWTGCCGDDGAVQLYTVIGGGHVWPGAYPVDLDAKPGEPARVGYTTRQLNASEVIWEFFEVHALGE